MKTEHGSQATNHRHERTDHTPRRTATLDVAGLHAAPRGSSLASRTMRAVVPPRYGTPDVERGVTLAEVADALRTVGEGHARGRTVVTVS